MGSAVCRYRIVCAFKADAAKKTMPATKTRTMRAENSRKFLKRYHGKSGSLETCASYTKAHTNVKKPRMMGASVPALFHGYVLPPELRP